MKRYAVRVEYIGENYSGSQIQGANKQGIVPKTIQSELEKALCTLIKADKPNVGKTNRQIKTVFSGRTDKGVNSIGQIVHFDCDETLVASKFINSMNGLLPNDISVADLIEVSKDFNARKTAKKRSYRYVFYNRKQRSAFDKDLLLVRNELNLDRMQLALNELLGEHDFSSFESADTSNENKICFIYKAECQKLGDEIVIDIEGSRFLYNMVRTIVGTLLMIEKENLEPKAMKEILEAKDRAKAGKKVNPKGLTLMKVEY